MRRRRGGRRHVAVGPDGEVHSDGGEAGTREATHGPSERPRQFQRAKGSSATTRTGRTSRKNPVVLPEYQPTAFSHASSKQVTSGSSNFEQSTSNLEEQVPRKAEAVVDGYDIDAVVESMPAGETRLQRIWHSVKHLHEYRDHALSGMLLCAAWVLMVLLCVLLTKRCGARLKGYYRDLRSSRSSGSGSKNGKGNNKKGEKGKHETASDAGDSLNEDLEGGALSEDMEGSVTESQSTDVASAFDFNYAAPMQYLQQEQQPLLQQLHQRNDTSSRQTMRGSRSSDYSSTRPPQVVHKNNSSRSSRGAIVPHLITSKSRDSRAKGNDQQDHSKRRRHGSASDEEQEALLPCGNGMDEMKEYSQQPLLGDHKRRREHQQVDDYHSTSGLKNNKHEQEQQLASSSHAGVPLPFVSSSSTQNNNTNPQPATRGDDSKKQRSRSKKRRRADVSLPTEQQEDAFHFSLHPLSEDEPGCAKPAQHKYLEDENEEDNKHLNYISEAFPVRGEDLDLLPEQDEQPPGFSRGTTLSGALTCQQNYHPSDGDSSPCFGPSSSKKKTSQPSPIQQLVLSEQTLSQLPRAIPTLQVTEDDVASVWSSATGSSAWSTATEDREEDERKLEANTALNATTALNAKSCGGARLVFLPQEPPQAVVVGTTSATRVVKHHVERKGLTDIAELNAVIKRKCVGAPGVHNSAVGMKRTGGMIETGDTVKQQHGQRQAALQQQHQDSKPWSKDQLLFKNSDPKNTQKMKKQLKTVLDNTASAADGPAQILESFANMFVAEGHRRAVSAGAWLERRGKESSRFWYADDEQDRLDEALWREMLPTFQNGTTKRSTRKGNFNATTTRGSLEVLRRNYRASVERSHSAYCGSVSASRKLYSHEAELITGGTNPKDVTRTADEATSCSAPPSSASSGTCSETSSSTSTSFGRVNAQNQSSRFPSRRRANNHRRAARPPLWTQQGVGGTDAKAVVCSSIRRVSRPRPERGSSWADTFNLFETGSNASSITLFSKTRGDVKERIAGKNKVSMGTKGPVVSQEDDRRRSASRPKPKLQQTKPSVFTPSEQQQRVEQNVHKQQHSLQHQQQQNQDQYQQAQQDEIAHDLMEMPSTQLSPSHSGSQTSTSLLQTCKLDFNDQDSSCGASSCFSEGQGRGNQSTSSDTGLLSGEQEEHRDKYNKATQPSTKEDTLSSHGSSGSPTKSVASVATRTTQCPSSACDGLVTACDTSVGFPTPMDDVLSTPVDDTSGNSTIQPQGEDVVLLDKKSHDLMLSFDDYINNFGGGGSAVEREKNKRKPGVDIREIDFTKPFESSYGRAKAPEQGHDSVGFQKNGDVAPPAEVAEDMMFFSSYGRTQERPVGSSTATTTSTSEQNQVEVVKDVACCIGFSAGEQGDQEPSNLMFFSSYGRTNNNKQDPRVNLGSSSPDSGRDRESVSNDLEGLELGDNRNYSSPRAAYQHAYPVSYETPTKQFVYPDDSSDDGGCPGTMDSPEDSAQGTLSSTTSGSVHSSSSFKCRLNFADLDAARREMTRGKQEEAVVDASLEEQQSPVADSELQENTPQESRKKNDPSEVELITL
ncbi:unnamed protein product [Amoebophrya sp. A25]|nr:unnamed protein product [Amoebophrya sp. A25]|eukprot:GSA25T00003860001.1